MLPTYASYLAMFPNSVANSPQQHLDFVAACEAWEINTPNRVTAFCAQLAHESSRLTCLVENLQYTAARLMQVWPRKFKTRAEAVTYQRMGAEAIANKVYAFVNGNGSEASGDGWRYRGRGWIQLTGKNNYRKYAIVTGLPLESDPDLAMVPKNANKIAAAFFSTNGCNELADVGDITEISRRINGGDVGLPERIALTRRFDAFNAPQIEARTA